VIIEGPMLVVALNGNRAPGSHPTLPIGIDQLAADAAVCVRAGAGAIHVHPRDPRGYESLEATVVDPVVRAIRAAAHVPIGVSTGAWIEPDPGRRSAAVATWRGPDMASVNLGEEGAETVMRALLSAGIGVEAGIWSVDDAERLARSGMVDRLTRVLIEIVDPVDDPIATALTILAALDRLDVNVPRLMHGEREATWPVHALALERGLDTRIGLEDTVDLPDGSLAPSNESLVRAALAAR
jgi:uncharacterized protein (DUF849 family)